MRWTGRPEGDLHPGEEDSVARWQEIAPRPWSWLRQVHGAGVVAVGEPGGGAGQRGDGLVSAHFGACLAVFTADCAPVALASPEGVMGVAHAGWRGLLAGVVGTTVRAMRALGATDVVAGLGPCVHPGCYEFSARDLDMVAAALGDAARGETAAGRPALDLPGAVRAALAAAGAELVAEVDSCTACSPDLFSHRAGADRARQAVVVWRP